MRGEETGFVDRCGFEKEGFKLGLVGEDWV